MAKSDTIPVSKPPIGNIKWSELDPNDDAIWQAKLDGAFLYYVLDKNGIRAFSYRRSKRDGKPIEHTHKLYGLRDAQVPEHLVGSVLSGEAWHPSLASREVGGILNTRTRDVGESLHAAIHGIERLQDVDLDRIDNHAKIQLLKGIAEEIPIFELPDTAKTPAEKKLLKRRIKAGKHPQTTEGLILFPAYGNAAKSVIEPTFDVPAVGVTPGAGRHEGTGVGAILVGNPESPTRVGTGLSDKLRQVLAENPDLVQGMVLRVKAKEKFPSGKLRAPALVEFHPEKSDPDKLRRLDVLMRKTAEKKEGDKPKRSRLLPYAAGGLGGGIESRRARDVATGEVVRFQDTINRRRGTLQRLQDEAAEWLSKADAATLERDKERYREFARDVDRARSNVIKGTERFRVRLNDALRARRIATGVGLIKGLVAGAIIGGAAKKLVDEMGKKASSEIINNKALIKHGSAEEFAPGIPKERKIQPIREAGDSEWELTVQRHNAHKAGVHYDLRLADPETGHAHSWALPKAMLPDVNKRVRLAVQQPTHTMEYMDFSGKIPEGYGAGEVELVHRNKVPVKVEPGKIHFEVPGHGDMVLIEKGNKNWLLVGKGMKKKAQTTQNSQFQQYMPRQNYAALGQHKLEGGNYDSFQEGAVAGTAGTGYMARASRKPREKLRKAKQKKQQYQALSSKHKERSKPKKITTMERAVAKSNPKSQTAKRVAEKSKHNVKVPKSPGDVKRHAAKGKALARRGRREVWKLRGEAAKSLLKKTPKALLAAGLTAGAVKALKSLWRSSSNKREKTAGDIMLMSMKAKLAAFKSNTDPSMRVGVSPFKKQITSKLKPPFRIEAPAVNTIRTGKSSTGNIQGDSVQGNPVKTNGSTSNGSSSRK